jgi:hypothetical protein
VSDRGHLPQGQAGVEVLLDVLDDGAELRSGERAVAPSRGLAGLQEVPEHVDGQMTGAWLVRYCALRSDTPAYDCERGQPGGLCSSFAR